jgi:hypothetical protein
MNEASEDDEIEDIPEIYDNDSDRDGEDLFGSDMEKWVSLFFAIVKGNLLCYWMILTLMMLCCIVPFF